LSRVGYGAAVVLAGIGLYGLMVLDDPIGSALFAGLPAILAALIGKLASHFSVERPRDSSGHGPH